jgi:hypothetical protein
MVQRLLCALGAWWSGSEALRARLNGYRGLLRMVK